MDKKVQYWIDLAEYDLETAEAMLETKRLLYVGFMCHQVIEKALKGYYVYVKDDIPEKIHHLIKLAKQSGLYDLFSLEHKKVLDRLTPLNIEARYPSEKEKLFQALTKEKCKDILVMTKELFQWIKLQLSKD
ncbi:MAG: HEPN domain-containing protein [Firmicutes bacterium]|nr:HEPN domain-containing protein [Bacillota bacterium]